jgi:hypothetical protein
VAVTLFSRRQMPRPSGVRGGSFPALTLASQTDSRQLGQRGAEPDSATEAQFWSWLAQLAVLRAEPGVRRAPPTMQMFLVVAPVGKAVGLRAIGSF